MGRDRLGWEGRAVGWEGRGVGPPGRVGSGAVPPGDEEVRVLTPSAAPTPGTLGSPTGVQTSDTNG